MNIIGIDPAGRTGFAYKMDGKWVTGTVSAYRWRDLYRQFKLARERGVEQAVMEDCYLGLDLKVLKRLVNIQGRVQSALEEAGIVVRMVTARSWKSAMLRDGGFAVMGRDAQKSRAMVVARRLGANPVTDDEGDAVCICQYGASTGTQGLLKAVAKATRRAPK
jgi:Holliday junction resolvasome RuvABC endonuclease subunit